LEKGEVTAAGPSPILTGFPIKLETSIRTTVFIEKKRTESQAKNKKFGYTLPLNVRFQVPGSKFKGYII
jgi:hypothetical protein